jgi:uncharacterized protein (DUF111 family)
MKVEKMSKPGHELNVTCDWCDKPSCYTALMQKTGVRLYACGKHKRILDETKEELNRYKHLSKIR